MLQVCKYMAPIADRFCMPSTAVPTSQNLVGIGVAIETDLSSEAKSSSPPESKRARTGTANSQVRTLSGESAEAGLLLRDIQQEQEVQQSARLAEVEDQPPVQELKWTYGNELTLEQRDQMHRLVMDHTNHFAF